MTNEEIIQGTPPPESIPDNVSILIEALKEVENAPMAPFDSFEACRIRLMKLAKDALAKASKESFVSVANCAGYYQPTYKQVDASTIADALEALEIGLAHTKDALADFPNHFATRLEVLMKEGIEADIRKIEAAIASLKS